MMPALVARSLRCARHMLMLMGLAAAYAPANVWADPIRLTSHASLRVFGVFTASLPLSVDERQVFGDFTDSSDSLGPVALTRAISQGDKDFGGGAAATITSVVQPSGIRVSGSTAADSHTSPLAPGSILTDFAVRTSALVGLDASFTLADPHLFDTVLQNHFQDGSGFAILAEATRGQIFSRRFGGNDSGALVGTLDPGNYTLSIALQSFASGTARFPGSESRRSDIDLSFALTPIAATPEPASIVLLGTGVIGLARRGRSRGTRQSSGSSRSEHGKPYRRAPCRRI